jgi:quercetin dioxygenase-like cupin family protein
MNNVSCIDSNSIEWKSVDEGVEIAVLRFEPAEVRVLLRFAPGKGYPHHRHPEGEEVFVIEGVYEDMGTVYNAGSYIYYPPNSDHAPTFNYTTHKNTSIHLLILYVCLSINELDNIPFLYHLGKNLKNPPLTK